MKAIVNHPAFSGTITIPRTSQDVRNQSQIPAWVLAWYAFAPLKDDPYNPGKHSLFASRHTAHVLMALERSLGSQTLISCLCNILDDMSLGELKPVNPVGLFIHRCRKMSEQIVSVID